MFKRRSILLSHTFKYTNRLDKHIKEIKDLESKLKMKVLYMYICLYISSKKLYIYAHIH